MRRQQRALFAVRNSHWMLTDCVLDNLVCCRFCPGCTCRPSAWTWGRRSQSLVPRIILLFFSLLSFLLAGVDVEALNLIEDVLHHYLEAVEAFRTRLLIIDLYNDNVTMILWITPKFTFSCFSCLWIILRMESSSRQFVDRKVQRLWADDKWHRFCSWSKRRHINNLIIIFPDICRTVSKCNSKCVSLYWFAGMTWLMLLYNNDDRWLWVTATWGCI